MVEKLVNSWSNLAWEAYSSSVVASILCVISFGRTAAGGFIADEFDNFWLLLKDKRESNQQTTKAQMRIKQRRKKEQGDAPQITSTLLNKLSSVSGLSIQKKKNQDSIWSWKKILHSKALKIKWTKNVKEQYFRVQPEMQPLALLM